MSKCCFSFKRQMVDIEQPFVNFFKIFFSKLWREKEKQNWIVTCVPCISRAHITTYTVKKEWLTKSTLHQVETT